MGDRRSGLFIFGLSLFVIWESIRLGLWTINQPGAGLLSFCAGVIMSALSLVLIYRGWKSREPWKSQKHDPRIVILVLVSLFVFSLVLDSLGFVVATFFLAGILFHLGESRPWYVLLGMSLSVSFISYYIFGVLLQVHFPKGFWGI